jgi:sulfofructose kinase
VPARVLCVGIATHDSIWRVDRLPAGEGKLRATAHAECGGGMAASAAVAVARLGGAASFRGRVGDDAIGQRILADLACEGVDAAAARAISGARSTVVAVLVDAQGQRAVVPYFDPDLPADPAWLRVDDVDGFQACLADVRWPEGAERLFEAAARAGVPRVLDGEIADPATLERLAKRATHAIFSAPALRAMTGLRDPEAGLARIDGLAPCIGVTAGEDGSWWRAPDGHFHQPAPRVEAIDTLAAGDVFHGAFALTIGEGRSTREAARFASAAAALKCRAFGGRTGCPRRDELDAYLEEWK